MTSFLPKTLKIPPKNFKNPNPDPNPNTGSMMSMAVVCARAYKVLLSGVCY